MFLSLAWAIFCDLDVNSEFMRCIGDSRYYLYFVYRLLFLRHYEATIRFNGASLGRENFNEEMVETEWKDSFKHVLMMNCAFADPNQK